MDLFSDNYLSLKGEAVRVTFSRFWGQTWCDLLWLSIRSLHRFLTARFVRNLLFLTRKMCDVFLPQSPHTMTSEIFLGAFIFCSIDFVCISNLTFRRRKKGGSKTEKRLRPLFQSYLAINLTFWDAITIIGCNERTPNIMLCLESFVLLIPHSVEVASFDFDSIFHFFMSSPKDWGRRKKTLVQVTFLQNHGHWYRTIFFARLGNGGVNPFLLRNGIKSPNNGC